MIEAGARKWERERNAQLFLAWHIAAFHRSKKLPSLKKLYLNNSRKPRQSVPQQMAVMANWKVALDKERERKAIKHAG